MKTTALNLIKPGMMDGIKTADLDITKPRIGKLRLDRNAMINLCLLSLSSGLAIAVHPAALLIWPVCLLLDDIFFFGFGKTIFDTEIMIQRGYQFTDMFLDDISGHGRDLGFNLFDGDLTKSRHQAQIDKWDFMIKQLGLKSGDRIIDIGCGYGDWLNYARSKGFHVTGVNISPEQAKYARSHYHLDIIGRNWKDVLKDPQLKEKLAGKFDAVTFMDTVEHYVSGRFWNGRDPKHDQERGEVYKNMFAFAHQLLDPRSRVARVFISCLHQTTLPITPKMVISRYLLIRYHSGMYPFDDDGLTKWSKEYFKELKRFDKTEDYRLTGVLDRQHFQAPILKWTIKKVLRIPLSFLLDPHTIHKWFDLYFHAWMNCYGEDCWDPEYNPEKRRETSFMRLWWLVLQHDVDRYS